MLFKKKAKKAAETFICAMNNVAAEAAKTATDIEKELFTDVANVPEEEWIWIDGYKGLDENMQGYDNFQFEVGKTYKMPENKKIVLCESGFHFCLNLKDVGDYYGFFDKSLYYKVRGLVRKTDVEKYGTRKSCGWDVAINKIVAKEIEILEMVDPKEVFETFCVPRYHSFITLEDFISHNFLFNYEIVEEVLRDRIIEKIKDMKIFHPDTDIKELFCFEYKNDRELGKFLKTLICIDSFNEEFCGQVYKVDLLYKELKENNFI